MGNRKKKLKKIFPNVLFFLKISTFANRFEK